MSANDGNSKLLETVRNLLSKANNTPYEAEADAFRDKANELMVKYAISQYDLDASGAAKQSKFGAHKFSLQWYWDLKGASSYEFRHYAFQLMQNVRAHCRLISGPQQGDDLILIGLKSDFEFFEMLFTSLLLDMTRMMIPRWNDYISREENVVNFKHAGFKWQAIAEQLRDHADYPIRYQINGQLHGCYIAMYKKGLKAVGGEQVKVQPQVHLRSFCMGFNSRIYSRLRSQKAAIDATPGAALVLVDMSKEMQEYANGLFPDHFAPKKPGKSLGRARYVQVSHNSMGMGSQAADKVDLGGTKLGHRKEIK